MISELDNKSNLYIILDKVNLKYLQAFIQMRNLMANKLLKLNLWQRAFKMSMLMIIEMIHPYFIKGVFVSF